ncbi:MAG: HAMP domain-containing sensor histidine kinase [Anaerolineae bacterium]
MGDLPATGTLLGSSEDDITGTTWLLGHDLKSPIAVVIGTLEMLIGLHEDDDDMADTVRLLRGALVAAKREYNMISDMLDLARFELNQYELDLQPTNLGGLLRESLEEEAYGLEVKKLQVEINIENQSQLECSVDVELFRRVFSALVDNVIKFTVRDDKLQIKAYRDGQRVCVKFIDDGRTIVPEYERDIFRRAPQWENRQAGSRSSVGMGLPFVNMVVQAHGGEFSAKSDQTTGLTYFTITIPALDT